MRIGAFALVLACGAAMSPPAWSASVISICFPDDQRLLDAIQQTCAKRYAGIDVICPGAYTDSQKVSVIVDTVIRAFSLGREPRLDSLGARLILRQRVPSCPEDAP